jgi:thiol-disulfide isomerase/thioredoxin
MTSIMLVKSERIEDIIMTLTPSAMLPLGTLAPDFSLPEPSTGKTISLHDFQSNPGLLVIFMCNHCPYVQHLAEALAQFARDYKDEGLAIVAINSNDVDTYEEDSPEHMVKEVRRYGYIFPYLYDTTQAVAKAYSAACTPDFFLFDHKRSLVYRGQFDNSRPGNMDPVTGSDLRKAVDALLAGSSISKDQKPSMGCNIKWRKESK